MNLLIRHIEYLISRNDCVIIPRLGAILAQYCPARIDTASGTIHPPCRKFTFNSSICDNDAAIAHSISKATGIPCSRAIDYVGKEVESMLHQLHTFGSVSLGRAGTLHYSADAGVYEFVPFADDRLSIATAFLPAVQAVRIPEKNATDYTESSVTESDRPLWSRISRIAAVIAVLIGVGFVASTPVSLDHESVLTASLAPDISMATKTPALISATQKAIGAGETIKDTPKATDAASAVAKNSLPAPARPTVAIADKDAVSDMDHGRFYIIIGATISEKEARKFIDQHPDIRQEARIVRYGKKHVIAVSVHDSPEEATSACIARRKSYPEAWIATK